jgi:hypothetical protein
MMSNIKKLYKQFFGYKLNEATTGAPIDPKELEAANAGVIELTKNVSALTSLVGESEIDEAQLVNNLTDYRGGIEYVVRDPQTAQSVLDEIRQWSEKKGFTIIKSMLSKTGRIGYIYYRLGEDPALESQKLQGYLAQKPELKHFRFHVRGEQQSNQPTTTTPTPTRNPQRNI